MFSIFSDHFSIPGMGIQPEFFIHLISMSGLLIAFLTYLDKRDKRKKK